MHDDEWVGNVLFLCRSLLFELTRKRTRNVTQWYSPDCTLVGSLELKCRRRTNHIMMPIGFAALYVSRLSNCVYSSADVCS